MKTIKVLFIILIAILTPIMVTYAAIPDTDIHTAASNQTPRIQKVEITDIAQCEYDQAFYNATVDVYYTGTTNLQAYIEYENNVSGTVYHSNRSYYTRFNIENIDSRKNACIHITATNDYDTTTRTIELLSGIGPTTPSSDISIITDGLNGTDIPSAFQSHSVHIDHKGNTLTGHKWKYLQQLKNGVYEVISTSEDANFTIPAITNESKYKINDEVCVNGMIIYQGTLDGMAVETIQDMSLDMKPHITKVEIIEKRPCEDNPTFYDVTLDAYYIGGAYTSVMVEEEDNSSTAYYPSYTQDYSRFHLQDIDSWRKVYISVTTENDYGSDTYTIELPATEDDDNTTSLKQLLSDSDIYCDVYDCKGIFIKRIMEYNEIQPLCNKGILFVKIFKDKRYVTTTKFINR